MKLEQEEAPIISNIFGLRICVKFVDMMWAGLTYADLEKLSYQ